MFSTLYNQVNVSDIINKSSVIFFYYIVRYNKEELKISCCSREESLHDMQKRQRSTTLLEEILLELHYHLARFPHKKIDRI